jgi:hypothetical protein
LLDASQGVAVLVQALRIPASQIGDPSDSDRSQVSSDTWTNAWNGPEFISVNLLVAHRITWTLPRPFEHRCTLVGLNAFIVQGGAPQTLVTAHERAAAFCPSQRLPGWSQLPNRQGQRNERGLSSKIRNAAAARCSAWFGSNNLNVPRYAVRIITPRSGVKAF